MTTFKTFWSVVRKYIGVISLYTILLIVFGGLNMSTNENQIDFVNSKPNVVIVNNDDDNKITSNLIDYIEENSKIINIKTNEESINDALFYRDTNYVIYIPKNYGKDVMNGLQPDINIKSTGDYQSSLAEIILTRYIKIQNLYKTKINNEDELINYINNNLNSESNIKLTSKLDTSKTSKATYYFNFASYSIMAVVIFIICLVLSSFKEKNVNKRTIISSTNYKKHNRYLLLSSFIYSIIVWILFVILGIILTGNIMFTTRGLIYILNLFIFTFCSLTLALLISTLITNKNAVNGIVNVVALGSAFLCGAFVPTEWLPDFVLRIAHILPSYWYINSNDLLKTMEVINLTNLKPIFINSIVILIFSILFIILNNIISKYKRKIG